MKAEIIAVGNEIVTGHTVNTNGSFIAKALQTIGVMTYYQSAVGDEQASIQEALELALRRSQLIVFTGGLGPTEDDLTKEAVCRYLKRPIKESVDCLLGMQNYFNQLGIEMTDNNKKQAAFPEGAYLLTNNHGTAPGCILKVEDCFIVLLPGPPKEMKPILEGEVLPYFQKQLKKGIYTLDIRLMGIGESALAEKIAPYLGEFTTVNVATYVGNYEVIARITGQGKTVKEAKEYAENMKNKLFSCLEDYIIGYNEDSLEESLLKLLQKYHYTIATVESCTGGLLAGTLINCSGVSAHYKEGFITYSNEAKEKYVGVRTETLCLYGAVSRQTAKEMAEGVKAKANAYIGLATTGIAGPEGGTPEKPVGLIYVGMAIGDETYVEELHLSGTRQEIREQTVKKTLHALFKRLRQI
ncbi:competence/damage-inducible protein A [Sporanaerobium hydrogeniformans]|uniref:Competence/damage-inducible protein A n=1 Tax=Sporanaerobium hydrogeniformans TaxID=3072179 RepID=A0AC61DEI6_9FIRM|nr:competence/damage-inducible protein A [Sporanaerobium hydrogeniformans]PHV71729.1 competence/damage-inducible protein A [Sporanaerobium hydrogeniformans]